MLAKLANKLMILLSSFFFWVKPMNDEGGKGQGVFRVYQSKTLVVGLFSQQIIWLWVLGFADYQSPKILLTKASS